MAEAGKKRKVKIKDYYKILGVERTASAMDIRRAFLTLMKKYHPDVNQNDPKVAEKVREINEAYHVLGDLDNRLRYSILLSRRVALPDDSDKK